MQLLTFKVMFTNVQKFKICSSRWTKVKKCMHKVVHQNQIIITNSFPDTHVQSVFPPQISI
jgi:hypothetical protein